MVKYFFLLLLFPVSVFSQQTDSLLQVNQFTANKTIEYQKPKLFSFITNIPKDAAGFTKNSFQKKNYTGLKLLAGATLFLWINDQAISNTVHDKFEDSKIVSAENFSPFINIKIGGKPTNIGKIPRNINTAFYDLGQGSSAMVLAAGFFIAGKITHDNRALQTAHQLTEAFIALGLGTQIIKFATGRENPSDATATRGRWQPFPSWSKFQNNKTKYDAFPSGHLATFVSAVTIIHQNYPEQRWIAPVGYSIAGLCGLAMINNGVHWASDFPLGFALGYGFGKYIARKTRFQLIP